MMIVFFDGYCGLCSGVVDFLIARDLARKLRYSPLQGETAAKHLTPNETTDLDTVIVVRIPESSPSEQSGELTAGSQKLRKSTAILACLKELGGVYAAFAALGTLVPISLRDIVYDLVAKNRFKIAARRETCRVPSPEERLLFLP